MEIHASRKNVGVARQTERGKVASVASSPQADTRWVNIGPALKIFSGSDDVFVFAGAAACTARSFPERAAITYAAAVIDRKHDVATIGEILVHRVGVRVVIHVVPAEQHLADWTTVHEDERGFLVRGVLRSGRWKEQLTVNLDTVRSFERHLLRRYQLLRRKIGWPSLGGECLRFVICAWFA